MRRGQELASGCVFGCGAPIVRCALGVARTDGKQTLWKNQPGAQIDATRFYRTLLGCTERCEPSDEENHGSR